MARDRQRGRQRRTRRSSDGSQAGQGSGVPEGRPGPETDPSLDPARDAGIEDVADDVGAEGTTPAPDPLKHASPYVDEAKLAEAGGDVDAPSRRDVAEEGVYADERPSAADRESAAGAGQASRPRRGRAIAFLGHSADELRRVQWPDRRHTGQGTAVTLGFVVLAGAFLGLMDALWQPLVEAII